MQRDNIKYKQLGPGCSVDVQALLPEHAENPIIIGTRRRSKPSAGLIVESEESFQVGALVSILLEFKGQPFTYRSRGMVSWVVDGSNPLRPHKLGVLIFGMDKLDPDGFLVSMAAASPIPTIETDSIPAPQSPIDTLGSFPEVFPEDEPASGLVAPSPRAPTPVDFISDELIFETGYKESPPTLRGIGPPTDREQAALEADTTPPEETNPGDLVSMCTQDTKIAQWLSTPVAKALPSSGEKAGLEPKTPKKRESRPSVPSTLFAFEKNPLATGLEKVAQNEMAARTSLAPVIPLDEFSLDIDVDFDHSFNAEEKMVEAFEQIHEMYITQDRDSAAAFALVLARSLITTEVGSSMLFSTKKYELYVSAAEGLDAASTINTTRPANQGVAGHVIRTDSTVRVTKKTKRPQFEPDFKENSSLKINNILSAPVQYDGHIIGVIELKNSPRKSGFVEGEANLLSYIGAALGEYIHNSLPLKDDRDSHS